MKASSELLERRGIERRVYRRKLTEAGSTAEPISRPPHCYCARRYRRCAVRTIGVSTPSEAILAQSIPLVVNNGVVLAERTGIAFSRPMSSG